MSSYLAQPDEHQLAKQIQNLLDEGFVPPIEYVRQPDPHDHHWHMWKRLSRSGSTNAGPAGRPASAVGDRERAECAAAPGFPAVRMHVRPRAARGRWPEARTHYAPTVTGYRALGIDQPRTGSRR